MAKNAQVEWAEKFAAAVELHKKGNLSAAKDAYEEILKIAPNHAGTIANLGSVLRELGRAQNAVALLERGHLLYPSASNISFNLGNAKFAVNDVDGALNAYMDLVRLDPRHAMGWYSVGVCLQKNRDHANAGEAYRKSLELAPDYYDTYLNLASVLSDLGRTQEAIAILQKATNLQPHKGAAWNNLGLALQEVGKFEESIEAYKRAFALEPSHRIASNILMGLQYNLSFTDSQLVESARSFGRRFPKTQPQQSNTKNMRALRLGFVSGDLYAHPVGFFLRAVVKELIGRNIACTFYSNSERIDDITQQLSSGARWYNIVFKSDDEVARKIREDEIDVLIDLSGHSSRNRLPVFALRPAPFQISWLGYFATTGLEQMDAIVMDPWHAPPGSESNFTEKVIRLPNTRFCYSPPDFAPPVGMPPATTKGYITFGSFNNTSKINDQVVTLWSAVLNAVPNSRLLLKWRSFEDKSFVDSVLQRFVKHGIDATRLELRGQSVHVELLRQYNEVDIALDPFPFNGGQTSCEALWMGVPVLTLPGNRPVSRQTLCFLANINKLEWVASDAAGYVAAAKNLAANIGALAEIRAKLREEMRLSTLCDAKKFTDDFLAVIETAASEHRRLQP